MAVTAPSSPTSETAAADGKSARLLSLDAFRGLTVLAMILVNSAGSWSNLYWPLDHAWWHGWTPTDLVFPFFLFIMGTSLAYSLRKYRDGSHVEPAVYWRIARRTLVLILLGLAIHLSARLLALVTGNADSLHFETLRYPGVLQRIGLVYFAASLVVLHLGERGQAVLVAALLFGYWAMLGLLPNPHDYKSNLSETGNVVRVVDIALFGESHLYTQAKREKTDPEGVLSTLPSIVTTIWGYWVGLMIQRRGANTRTVALMLGIGLACTVIGLGWGAVFPISKKLWTSSFVILTGGLAMVILAGCLLKFDVWGWRRIARPWEAAGINAIFAFVASDLLAILLDGIKISGVTAKEWIYSHCFTSWITEPKLASFAYAAATLAFWWAVLWFMAKRGWTMRV